MWIIFVIFHFPSFYVLAPCFLFRPCHRCLLLVRLQSPFPCGLRSSWPIAPFPTFTLLFISMAPISYLFPLGCHSTLFYLIFPLLPLLDVTCYLHSTIVVSLFNAIWCYSTSFNVTCTHNFSF
jgi:hypothetical protein